MPIDRLQHEFTVGELINIPATVTAIAGTSAQPTVTVTTKYAGFDGNTDSLGPVDCIQVVKDQQIPRT